MASNKKADTPHKRRYTLKVRARRLDEIHRRITLAAVHLHGTVGPARTTVSDIAKHAGVRRATVYNHFATDRELFDACSSHWFTENPPPDPGPWAEIADPFGRTKAALLSLYEYYDRGREMLDNVLRDAPLVTALEEILKEKWAPMMEGIAVMLADGWSSSEVVGRAEVVELRSSLRVALDFFTWKTLAASGLSNENAARLAATWVRASVASVSSTNSGATRNRED